MYILRHFTDVCQEAEFLSLEAERMLELIGESDLKVGSEDLVCMSAINWIKHDSTSRMVHFDSVVQRLCLHQLSSDCYMNLLAFSKFTLSETVLPEPQRLSINSSGSESLTLGRCSRNYEEMLVVLGVHKATKMLPAVHAYSLSQSAWYKLCPLPFDPGVGYATCVHDNNIYISGISLRRGYMLKYDSEDNQWSEVLEMQDRRRYHEMVVMGEFIYVVGGCNKRDGASDVIARYNVDEGVWKYVGHLQLGVYSASATVAGESILVFGGRAEGSIRRREIQSYNTRSKTSYVVNRLVTLALLVKSLPICQI